MTPADIYTWADAVTMVLARLSLFALFWLTIWGVAHGIRKSCE